MNTVAENVRRGFRWTTARGAALPGVWIAGVIPITRAEEKGTKTRSERARSKEQLSLRILAILINDVERESPSGLSGVTKAGQRT